LDTSSYYYKYIVFYKKTIQYKSNYIIYLIPKNWTIFKSNSLIYYIIQKFDVLNKIDAIEPIMYNNIIFTTYKTKTWL